MRSVCSVTNCGKPEIAKRYCRKHYARWKRTGDPLKSNREHSSICEVIGCKAPYYASGRCKNHHVQFHNAAPEMKEKLKARQRKPFRRFQNMENSCKRTGKSWQLSLEQFIQFLSEPCFYCGASLLGETGAGLDRIDNANRSYSKENCLPCCGACNRIRSQYLSVHEMVLVSVVRKAFKNGVFTLNLPFETETLQRIANLQSRIK